MMASRDQALKWIDQDPNTTTGDFVKGLLAKSENGDSDATKELAFLFPTDGSRIGFGTAGLRAAMKPGPLGMNDLVVVQTAQGLARYCQKQNSEQQKLTIVIGYDHRNNAELELSSLSFAILSAMVFNQAGMDCILLDGFVHTPTVAFSTTRLGAAAGIMITASHNPKNDAGYKVYWSDGCQIRPPQDKEIASSILENLEPWADYRALLNKRQKTFADDKCLGLSDPTITQQMKEGYFEAIGKSGLVVSDSMSSTSDCEMPSFAYTAMHGVGYPFAKEAFDVFGLPPFSSVPSQQDPDPSFPSVPFPNPEEKGALDLGKAFAEEKGCDILLANDPDADRLAVAERNRSTKTWTVFTGDQIGTLLGHWLWEKLGKGSEKPIAMCASTVSSKMLAEIARREGFHFEDTLTGFKWIGTRAKQLTLPDHGYRSIFCYEEAIGFCCGDVIFDKDGVSAAGVFAQLACHVYSQGTTVAEHLQSLYNKYGEFVSNNGYYIYKEKEVVRNIFEHIRNNGQYVTNVGGYEVDSIRDLGEPGYDSSQPNNRPVLPTSKSSPMMTISFANGCVAQFRASGTEPKFKYYTEMRGAVGKPREEVELDMQLMSEMVLEELLQPSKNGLLRR